jgi:hypothetical protein
MFWTLGIVICLIFGTQVNGNSFVDTNHIIVISKSGNGSYFGYSSILLPSETEAESGW